MVLIVFIFGKECVQNIQKQIEFGKEQTYWVCLASGFKVTELIAILMFDARCDHQSDIWECRQSKRRERYSNSNGFDRCSSESDNVCFTPVLSYSYLLIDQTGRERF